MEGEKLGIERGGHRRVQYQLWLWPTQQLWSPHNSFFRTVIISCKKAGIFMPRYPLVFRQSMSLVEWKYRCFQPWRPEGSPPTKMPILTIDMKVSQEPECTNSKAMSGYVMEPCLPPTPLTSGRAPTIHSTNPPGGGQSQFLEERSFKRGFVEQTSPHTPRWSSGWLDFPLPLLSIPDSPHPRPGFVSWGTPDCHFRWDQISSQSILHDLSPPR